MVVYPLQVAGSRGEVTPLMHARVDTDFYQSAFALARNMVVTRYGAMTRVPGTEFMGATKFGNRKSRLLPFEFSAEQVYALEFGHQYIRFWTPAGQVVDGGAPYEIASPYDEDDLPDLRWAQSADELYIWCGGMQPRVLRRASETSWSLTAYEATDGPYMDAMTEGTTLTPSDYGSLTPKMTSNTTPSGTVTGTSPAEGGLWLAFDKDKSTTPNWSTTVAFIAYQLPGASTGVVDSYYLTATPNASNTDRSPVSWTLDGSNDGTNWVTLDSRDGETGWTAGETRFYEFENKVGFNRYRFSWSGADGAGGRSLITELGLNRADAPPITFTASSTAGINGGDGFKASDVGRSIRIRGADRRWRWFRIATVANATTVTGVLRGHALPDIGPIGDWRLGAWSDETGWPRVGTFHEDRLVQASTDTDPIGVWLSKPGGYDNYGTSDPIVDDDGISVRLTGGKLNSLEWLVSLGALLGGTASSLRSIGNRDASSALSPTNVRQRNETEVASAAVTPVAVENVVIFVDRAERRLYEAAYDYQADGYLAREVSVLNEHMFAEVEQLVYLDVPHKFVVARLGDGNLVFFAYDREQKVAGGVPVDIAGDVEDITDLDGGDRTDLWLTVKRDIDGQTVRYVEKLARFWRSDDVNPGLPVYSECSFIYDGAATSTLSGLDALEGEEVGVWADGRDIGDATVTGGNLTLPHGQEGSQIVVGLRVPWKLRTLRLPQIGNQDGSGLGRKARVVSVRVDLYESAGVEAGTLVNLAELVHEDAIEHNPDMPTQLLTGMYRATAEDRWSNDGVVRIEGSKMYPATVRAIMVEVDGEP